MDTKPLRATIRSARRSLYYTFECIDHLPLVRLKNLNDS